MYSGADITVITPTIPGRNTQLIRAMESVRGQTIKPDAHIIVNRTVDLSKNVRQRISESRNQGIQAAHTSFCAFLDDDNAWLPEHLECLLRTLNAVPGTDVAYSPCVPVDLGNGIESVFNGFDVNNIDNLIKVQKQRNQIDTNCVVSTYLLRRYPFEEYWKGSPARCSRHGTCISEDHDLFTCLIEMGAKFTWCPTATWMYSVDYTAFKSSVERRSEKGNV